MRLCLTFQSVRVDENWYMTMLDKSKCRENRKSVVHVYVRQLEVKKEENCDICFIFGISKWGKDDNCGASLVFRISRLAIEENCCLCLCFVFISVRIEKNTCGMFDK